MEARRDPAYPRIVDLAAPEAAEPAVAGRKAATLAQLRADGFAVPDGFVVPADTCADFEPEDVRATVEQALAAMGDPRVAVRSSAVAEDLAEASYAGMYETVLGVRGPDAVLDAARRCVASSQADRVAAYSADEPGSMAVLVQRLVDPEAAGVAFSADPVTGDRDVTIVSAVKGLGDRLVDGTAIPDEWTVRSQATGDGVDERSVSEHALDPEQVRAVAALARRLEEHRGRPQDIEWAWDGERLWLLQSRPITVLPQKPDLDLPESGSWMKDRTHYPEPVTPFGASVYLPVLEAGIENMCEEFGLLIESVEQRSLGGEIYGRPVPAGGKEGPPPPWWVLAVLSRVVPPIRRRCAAAREALRSGLLEELPRRWWDEWRDEFIAEAERLSVSDMVDLDDEALLRRLDEAIDLLHRGQEVHFRLFIPYVVRVHQLADTCADLFGWDTAAALGLVAGRSEASTAPTRALHDLAARLAGQPAAEKAVKALDLGALADQPDAWEAFDEYRRRWGVRAAGYDPGSPTLAEQPHLLLRWLRDAMAETDVEPSTEDAPELIEEARAALADRSEDERARFEEALSRADDVYGLREDNILWTDNVPCGVIRLLVMEIGRRLRERDLVERSDDVVFLEVEEVRQALRDGVERSETARRRRAERAWVAANPGPPFLGEDPVPPPDIRGLPREARVVNGALMWAMGEEFPPPDESPDTDTTDALLDGVGASPGTYTGPARVVSDESQFAKLQPGDVLVCNITTPSWSVLFGRAGAVVANGGSALSHSAIVAREHGIPAVLATREATSTLRDGQLVTVDGVAGVVRAASEG